jgi:cytochrome b561
MSVAPLRPAAGEYATTAKVLHWVIAVAVIGLIVVGIGREFMPKGPTRDFVTMLHKATGIVVGALMILRLAWRLSSPPPPSEPYLARWQIGLSHAVHWSLYAILLAMPAIGWVASNALGRPVSMYGLFDLPTLSAEDKPFGESLFDLHGALGYVAAGLIALHVGAALYHRIVKRDGVLARMT